MKAVWPVIASNGVPYFQMSSVGSHNTSGREKEGKNERTGPEMCASSNQCTSSRMTTGRDRKNAIEKHELNIVGNPFNTPL